MSNNNIIFEKFSLTKIRDEDVKNLNNFDLIYCPEDSYLLDTRPLDVFKIYGFDKKNKKTEMLKALEKALVDSNIEHGFYWSFQLMASGSVNQVWDKLLNFYIKQINLGNPKLPSWIYGKYKIWYFIIENKRFAKNGILEVRNIQQFRNLISEMVFICCQSRKKKLETFKGKINDQDFDLNNIHYKCVSRDNNLISGLVGESDPQEIILGANEFCYHIIHKNIQQAFYWLNWVLYWEKLNVKKYKSFVIQHRNIAGIDYKDQGDVIWLIWSIIHQLKTYLIQNNLLYKTTKENKLLDKEITALWNMYLYKWRPANKSKKLHLINLCINYLINPVDWSITLIDNVNLFIKAIVNNNILFKKIKQQCNVNQSVLNSNIQFSNQPLTSQQSNTQQNSYSQQNLNYNQNISLLEKLKQPSQANLISNNQNNNSQTLQKTQLLNSENAPDLNKLINANNQTIPTPQDIGNNNGLNIVISNNYLDNPDKNIGKEIKKSNEAMKASNKKELKTSNAKKKVESEEKLQSMNKLDIVSQIDPFLT